MAEEKEREAGCETGRDSERDRVYEGSVNAWSIIEILFSEVLSFTERN